jgi:hypothetical protein
MRQVLINEVCNEKPNAQALGAYNAAVSSGSSSRYAVFGDKFTIDNDSKPKKFNILTGDGGTRQVEARYISGKNVPSKSLFVHNDISNDNIVISHVKTGKRVASVPKFKTSVNKKGKTVYDNDYNSSDELAKRLSDVLPKLRKLK